MDINVIAQLVGSVGFPICMSIYLIYFMQTELKEEYRKQYSDHAEVT